ncbi:uncharacterized protein LOC143203098 [Rhynchophorus ferrugineus]|uniref:Uncharacterized protein n=1 Tax=Rhynchophorus ferrugineus TaxID=354439 RepID=A0A834HSP1_RHYFE|nr:hypothetical protein GWI33_020390 [Rhynchophorus ferrugineus]
MEREDKEVQNDIDYDDAFKENVYCCITYLTHKCPLMQKLFSQWTDLTCQQRALLSYCAFHIFEKEEIAIFSCIVRGINYWNNIQDTEGACGYTKDPFEFRLGKDQENQIFQMVTDINQMIYTIKYKGDVCQEIINNKIIFHNKKLLLVPKHFEEGDAQ